ncbi:MAG TPA: flagellar hook-associated protein FlgK, partial [Methyloradius sp.]
MATSNILSIGQSALSAAQAGISTTGHNIANASTPGYSRQIVIQGSAGAQNFGYGYVGQGTQVTTVQRIFNNLLASQISTSQSSYNQINTYATQMSQIDNMLADSTAGVSPALQNFFNTAQTLSANPSDASARQAYLSASQALASRFQSVGNQLNSINDSVNSQISSSITTINSYTSQIANLNDMITKAQNLTGQPPNDLLDQRDQLVSDLSKEIKVTVVNQQGSYNVFVGNGQPMVVGGDTYKLVPV